MAQGYVHVEIEQAQSAKRPGEPCGDVVACQRTLAGTTVACVDGIGSGIRAHIAAQMCAARLLESLRLGCSLHKAVGSIVRTMEQVKRQETGRPYAAFSVARIRNDGLATVLSYDAPTTLLLNRGHAMELPVRPQTLGGGLVNETTCYLEPDDGLLLVSDGITQAGLGTGLSEGWRLSGVARYLDDALTGGLAMREAPQRIEREARRLWKTPGDDTTAVLAACRRGQVVNILSGPPASRDDDDKVVRRFLQCEGLKIVCGGTTAEIVARSLRRQLTVEQKPTSLIAPPRYDIDGIDLVTEGAVTLNQVYNVLDEDIGLLTEDSGVTDLCSVLMVADRVNFYVGTARNDFHGHIAFRQRGILTRDHILPLLATRLRAAGKLVVVHEV